MGWTGTHACHYYYSGQINRKAECDALFSDKAGNSLCIVKSTMVGTTYYAAVKRPEEQDVFGIVILTTVDNKSYFNFTYKEISEFSGPAEAKCPEHILKLLSPVDDEWANEWRRRCHHYNARKKQLDALPIGAKVTVDENSRKVEYEKSDKVKKRPVWVNWEKRFYIKTDQLLDYEYVIGG